MRLGRPTEVLGLTMVDPEEMKAGDEGVIVLVETVGGPLALKMTAAVAESIYHAIYERAKGN